MSRQSTKTDNKSIANKIFIRKEAIKNLKEVKVLDLFAGRNVLWNNIKTDKYFGIEIEKNKGKNLNVDVRKVFDNLDLSAFNVIDCDSYGLPFDLMKKILTRELYKKIKQMDRQEMQLFLENLYQEGRDSVPGIDVNRIKEIVMEVKGVGEKKASLIEQKIREAFQEGEEKWD